MTMTTTTQKIRIPASQYEDHDDCLAAAAAEYVEEHPDAEGWDLNARWENDSRDVILLDAPVTAKKNPAAVALGRKGGKVTSEAKAAAVRANGAKGGRPNVTHYACSECPNTIAKGEPGWEDWSCPDHAGARVDSIAGR